jgi:hypothetical protein
VSVTSSPLDRERERRMRTYPLLVLAVLGLMVVVAAVQGGSGERRIGGDYPAFYGAGSIVLDGDVDRLYDAARQQDAQDGFLDDKGDYLYFAYPPPVAAAYAPLAALDFTASYLVHTALMVAALCGAVLLVRPMVPLAARFPAFVVAVALLSYPMLRAVLGGQNTALTLLLLAWAWRAEHDGQSIVAGIAAGLLLYKPQFAVPLLLLALVGRRVRMVAAGVAVGGGWWGFGSIMMGPAWMADWWQQARDFAAVNADVNGSNFIGLPGVSEHLLGPGWPGWILAGVVAAATAVQWIRFADAEPRARYGVAAPALALVAPQALFYEAGLMLLPLAVLSRQPGQAWAVGLWAASWTGAAAGLVGGTWPLALVVAVSWIVMWRRVTGD